MRPTEQDAGLLWDMRKYCSDLLEITAGADLEDYLEDKRLRLAVERCLQVVGEAAARLSPEFRTANPHVPWHKMKGMRNILVHDYGRIDYEIIYESVNVHVPELMKIIEALLIPFEGNRT
jgi:uncharacterized protein with HEPN domain